MTAPQQRPSRQALALLGLVYAVGELLIVIHHDRHASTVTTAALGVFIWANFAVGVYVQNRRQR